MVPDTPTDRERQDKANAEVIENLEQQHGGKGRLAMLSSLLGECARDAQKFRCSHDVRIGASKGMFLLQSYRA